MTWGEASSPSVLAVCLKCRLLSLPGLYASLLFCPTPSSQQAPSPFLLPGNICYTQEAEQAGLGWEGHQDPPDSRQRASFLGLEPPTAAEVDNLFRARCWGLPGCGSMPTTLG